LYLVQLETALPASMSEIDRGALLTREAARGSELRDDGTIQHIWRLPGRLANVGVWSAEDAATLHDMICSLPAWPWMTVSVTCLTPHPLDP
jgi:muconolactone D-isomerase